MADEYRTGRGKPPREHQFKKGQSGNPSGRPKGSRNLKTLAREELTREIQITENGQPVKTTMWQAVVKNLHAKSLHGNDKATELVLNLARWADQDEAAAGGEASDQDDNQVIADFLARARRKEGKHD